MARAQRPTPPPLGRRVPQGSRSPSRSHGPPRSCPLRRAVATGLHDRRGRAGRLRQDSPCRGALPSFVARNQSRRDHQRHLHPRGCGVSFPQRRAADRADRGRSDRRLPSHGHPRRRQRQLEPQLPTSSDKSPGSSWCWSNRVATTSPPSSRASWPTASSSSLTWRKETRSPARAVRVFATATCL